jgi:hypothetical protein
LEVSLQTLRGRAPRRNVIEGGTLVVETQQSFGVHSIRVLEKYVLSDDGKVLTYSHEVWGPSAGQHESRRFEFGLE